MEKLLLKARAPVSDSDFRKGDKALIADQYEVCENKEQTINNQIERLCWKKNNFIFLKFLFFLKKKIFPSININVSNEIMYIHRIQYFKSIHAFMQPLHPFDSHLQSSQIHSLQLFSFYIIFLMIVYFKKLQA